jgi:hypothetical protein
VPCALQDGVIARKKISDVFLQPKHIEVSLLVWYLFCDIISTDEDPGLRIESFAVINLRGVSTNKTIIFLILFMLCLDACKN